MPILTRSESLEDFSDNRRAVLLTSASSHHAASRLQLAHILAQYTVPFGTTLPPSAATAEVIVAVGGGSVVDAAKLLGTARGLPVIAVPTILSTDAFLTSAAAVRRSGWVTYVPTGCPEQAVIDFGLLSEAPAWRNAMGSGDVLTMLTAAWDWASDPQSYAPTAVLPATAAICERLLCAEEAIVCGSRDGLEAVLQGLIAEVDLCREARSDRLEEGSEHFFAYAFEPHAPGWMHGSLVALGIVFARTLQGEPVSRLLHFFGSTGIAGPWRTTSPEVVASVLQRMRDEVREAGMPWSIWNVADLTQREAMALARDAIEGTLP